MDIILIALTYLIPFKKMVSDNYFRKTIFHDMYLRKIHKIALSAFDDKSFFSRRLKAHLGFDVL